MEDGTFQAGMGQLEKQMEFLRLFRQLHSTLRENVDRNIKALELTTSQLDVLICVAGYGGGPVSQRKIEEELRLTNPTVTGILKRLEKKGFITRTVRASDRRYREVRLTGRCSQLADRLQPGGQAMLHRAFRGFSPEEFDCLNRMLGRLLENCAQLDAVPPEAGSKEDFPSVQAERGPCPPGHCPMQRHSGTLSTARLP